MALLEDIIYYVNMVGISIIITMLIVVAVLYYFLKVKKIAARVENINTSYFKREDTMSYVPFKDIVGKSGSLNSEGMFVISDRVFVGGISVRGFDYASASAAERVDAQLQSVAFFNVVETPTTFRQTLKSTDLRPNIEEYEEQKNRIAMEQMKLDAEYQATIIAADDYEDEPEMYAMYDKRMNELRKELFAKAHMLQECDSMISYMQAISGDVEKRSNVVGGRDAQIMFSWVYDPDKYTEELTNEEVYLKAQEELNTIANAYKEALAMCHFKAKRLSVKELIKLMYNSTHPMSGDSADIKELLDSSYSSLFVSSDSLVSAQIN